MDKPRGSAGRAATLRGGAGDVEMVRNIVIVEDESDLANVVRYHLEREGYRCRLVSDGEAGLHETYRSPPDLLILDRMLPRLSGDEVAKRVRSDPRTANVPILMITAKAEDEDELVGFALGADDYVRKPFSVKLLLARVAAILRRRDERGQAGEVYAAGPVVIDRGRHELTVGGRPVELTATEFRILDALIRASGRVLTREQLLNAATGEGTAVTDRAVDVHIASLRKKLTRDYDLIHTIRGVGYAFRVGHEPS